MKQGERKIGTAATRAKNKYNEKNYDRISVIVPIGEKEKISRIAKTLGYKSTNEFIVSAIKEKEERENNCEM